MPNPISVYEFYECLERGDDICILDVRAADAFQEWRIQSKHHHPVNIQVSKLRANGVSAYPAIRKDAEVITVCAKGIAAQEAASLLEANGYQVRYLQGGMQAWSEFYYTKPVVNTPDFRLIQIIRPAKGCLSYLVASGDQGIVVDSGRHTDVYMSLAKQQGVRIQHVMDTHLHADHISGGFALAQETGAKYWMSPGESRGGTRVHQDLQDGMRFDMGSIPVQVIALPGHTPGSVGLWVNKQYLICGDTLFVQGIGRPDLGGHAKEWARLLYRTLTGPIQVLPADTILLPTHFSDVHEITEDGYVAAPLEDVLRTIEFREQDEDAFVDSILKRVTTTPPNYLMIVDINRGVLQVAEEEALALEIGPNRCAVKA